MLVNIYYSIHDHSKELIKMTNLKWIVIGSSAYAICPRCGNFPLFFYGHDEYHSYLLQCKRCGILVSRKTPIEQLQKRAVKRFWGGQIAKKS